MKTTALNEITFIFQFGPLIALDLRIECLQVFFEFELNINTVLKIKIKLRNKYLGLKKAFISSIFLKIINKKEGKKYFDDLHQFIATLKQLIDSF